ncbi:MAG: MBL fold metallo-hydrolase [Candidatus Sungbacteria bacterium]|nr:MBL fold metallo-hydrolase [Candidatus Sungbacteria bacterium]
MTECFSKATFYGKATRMNGDIRMRFYGIMGSLPAPRQGAYIEAQNEALLAEFVQQYQQGGTLDPREFLAKQPRHKKSVYGGNTSCVEVVCGTKRIVWDMGSGARVLGASLMKEMFANGGLEIAFLLSHTHWDHIQGFPFFVPLFGKKGLGIKNNFTIYGGTKWMEDIEACLQRQMEYRVFPVSWDEIKHMTESLLPRNIYDADQFDIGDTHVVVRLLNHPGGSLGYRLIYKDKVLAYTTDNEPFDPLYPDLPLVDTARGADIWVTDCQYLQQVYLGLPEYGGLRRFGWGHSYPQAVAITAIEADVKLVVLFHHDPASTDARIKQIEDEVCREIRARGHDIPVVAAYEGMELAL